MTTKANGNDIDVFRVGRLGYLSTSPVVNSEPGAVPFPPGHVLVTDAGTNAVSSFSLRRGGNLIAARHCRYGPGRYLLDRAGPGSFLRFQRRERFGDRLRLGSLR